jgi:thiamine-phosphate pyrophosphorylase
VFHVGQKDISLDAARGFLGKDAVIGLSTHSPEQVDAAIAAAPGRKGLDYFCVGPVWATPTKPGRAAVGLDLVRYAAQAIDGADAEGTGKVNESLLPWFAIGGIDLSNVEQVVDAGARRIVVVRAITDAADPAHAARALLAALDAAAA